MLVIFSGGQDSTTCLYWAKKKSSDVIALTFNYGQLNKAEIQAAKKIAKLAKVKHIVLSVKNILQSTSPLINSDYQLKQYKHSAELKKPAGEIEPTFVPMRNAFFLTIAANIALAHNKRRIVTGVSEIDDGGYPDCTRAFIEHQEATINKALGIADFRIEIPLISNTKADTVRLAAELEGCLEALRYSVTCYAGEIPPCNKCHSCVLRAQGFEEAGVKDPLLRGIK